MSTLKIKALEIYYKVKHFIPTLKDSIKKWIVSKVMKSEYASLEKSHSQDPYCYIENSGSDYNYALFFPVYAVHLCLFNVFKTNLDYVMKAEKGFNFSDYYNSTPFSDNSTKITANTLKYTVKTIVNMI